MKHTYNPTEHFNQLWNHNIASGRLRELRRIEQIGVDLKEGKSVNVKAKSQNEVFDYCHRLQEQFDIQIAFKQDDTNKDIYILKTVP